METITHIREVAHPTPRTYILIAALLAAITGIEVGIFYIEAIEDVIIPLFIVLSLVKFVLVAMFYMHLKFDERLFSGLFVGGLILATSVIIALMALFGVLLDTPSFEAAADTGYTHQVGTVGDQLKFSTGTLTAKAGEQVVLEFNNNAATQQHNWVLIPTGIMDEIAAAGLAAGPASHWVPDDDRVIAHTILLGPGESNQVQFFAPAAGTYQFTCTFPGHSATMFGTFEVSPQ